LARAHQYPYSAHPLPPCWASRGAHLAKGACYPDARRGSRPVAAVALVGLRVARHRLVWGFEKKKKGEKPLALAARRFGNGDGPPTRKESVMPRTSTARRRRSAVFDLQKPTGQLTPRVQAVGPERFGLVCFDCAKHRSRYFLADFYGKVLIAPTSLEHGQGALQAAIAGIRQAMRRHHLGDLTVAIERTGEYHRPVQRAFRAAGFDTRVVHPFTAKQYRQPADPDDKTDDHDLAAIFHATTQGFGLCEPVWPDHYLSLQILRRHRRDIVDKNSKLRCQILEKLHAALPGYAECFGDFWKSAVALALARQVPSAAEVLKAGLAGLQAIVKQAQIRCRQATLA